MVDMKIFSGKKIVITGGVGFIGSNLAKRFNYTGADVTLIDSLMPEYGGNLFNIDNIEKNIRVNLCDVRDSYALKPLLEGCDFLFNLAGQTSHMDSMLHPQVDLNINAAAQLSILELCR